MVDHPPLPPGFARLAVLLAKPATPGQLAQATGCDLDDLGYIWVEADQALLDVRAEVMPQARSGLDHFGPTQIQQRPEVIEPEWRWLRLAVGRNHGMTLGQFKRIMQRSGAEKLGKIHLNNTHTLVGIRDDLWQQVCAYLSELKINGIAVRPGPPQAGETYDSPVYVPNHNNFE